MDLPSRTENNDAVGGNIRETRFLGGHRIYRLYDRHGLKSECGSCVWIAEASAARSRSSVTRLVSKACAPSAAETARAPLPTNNVRTQAIGKVSCRDID